MLDVVFFLSFCLNGPVEFEILEKNNFLWSAYTMPMFLSFRFTEHTVKASSDFQKTLKLFNCVK